MALAVCDGHFGATLFPGALDAAGPADGRASCTGGVPFFLDLAFFVMDGSSSADGLDFALEPAFLVDAGDIPAFGSPGALEAACFVALEEVLALVFPGGAGGAAFAFGTSLHTRALFRAVFVLGCKFGALCFPGAKAFASASVGDDFGTFFGVADVGLALLAVSDHIFALFLMCQVLLATFFPGDMFFTGATVAEICFALVAPGCVVFADGCAAAGGRCIARRCASFATVGAGPVGAFDEALGDFAAVCVIDGALGTDFVPDALFLADGGYGGFACTFHVPLVAHCTTFVCGGSPCADGLDFALEPAFLVGAGFIPAFHVPFAADKTLAVIFEEVFALVFPRRARGATLAFGAGLHTNSFFGAIAVLCSKIGTTLFPGQVSLACALVGDHRLTSLDPTQIIFAGFGPGLVALAILFVGQVLFASLFPGHVAAALGFPGVVAFALFAVSRVGTAFFLPDCVRFTSLGTVGLTVVAAFGEADFFVWRCAFVLKFDFTFVRSG